MKPQILAGKVINQLAFHQVFSWMPDKPYLKLIYWASLHKRLDLDNPQSFSEKLQWLKLYNRNSKYIQMSDKYDVKEYIADMIGEQYIIPTLGVWNNFDEIDFDALPLQFVLKCTHDSGSLVICRDKSKFNESEAKEKIDHSLKINYYKYWREWPYKDIKPRIIAEKYMENPERGGLIDYKFFCFNGQPKFVYVSSGLENHKTARISFVTLDWEKAPYERIDYHPFEELPSKPSKFDEMVDISKRLSKNIPFVRVDLYQISNQVFFSELTFFPCAGFIIFKDRTHDYELGEMLKL